MQSSIRPPDHTPPAFTPPAPTPPAPAPPARRGAGRSGIATTGAVSKRRAETQHRLLTAAAEVFAERGFGRATVEDVCERAGYSRGAFYSNFDSLDHLFFALYELRSAELVDAVRRVVEDMPDSMPLAEVVDQVIAVLPISRDTHLLNLEFAAHALRHSDVAAGLAAHRRAVREALTPIIRAGLTAADADFDGADLDALARAVVAVQDGMFLQELLEPGEVAVPALRRRLLTTVLAAATTDGRGAGVS